MIANVAKSNGGGGFGLFFGSNGSTFTGNHAVGNVGDGFRLFASHGNTLNRSVAANNTGIGFVLDGNGGGCSGNSLTENVGKANAQGDATRRKSSRR